MEGCNSVFRLLNYFSTGKKCFLEQPFPLSTLFLPPHTENVQSRKKLVQPQLSIYFGVTKFELLAVDAEGLEALVHRLAPVARGQHQAVGVRAGVPVGRQTLHPQQLICRARRRQRRRRLPFTMQKKIFLFINFL